MILPSIWTLPYSFSISAGFFLVTFQKVSKFKTYNFKNKGSRNCPQNFVYNFPSRNLNWWLLRLYWIVRESFDVAWNVANLLNLARCKWFILLMVATFCYKWSKFAYDPRKIVQCLISEQTLLLFHIILYTNSYSWYFIPLLFFSSFSHKKRLPMIISHKNQWYNMKK